MVEGISRITITEYLPVIQAFLASMETERATMKDYDKAPRLGHEFLSTRFDDNLVSGAMDLIGLWLEGTKFTGGYGGITKVDSKVPWLELINLLHSKIDEYENTAEIIVLDLSKDGLMTRKHHSGVLEHQFERNGMKCKIVRELRKEEYLSAEDLRQAVKSSSKNAVIKAVGEICAELKNSLQLPKQKKFILHDGSAGYYIAPTYNVIIAK